MRAGRSANATIAADGGDAHPRNSNYMSALAAFQSRHPTFVRAFTSVLAMLAVLKLGSEMYRLTLSTAPNGAIDLGLRYEEVQRWFAGEPVYSAFRRLAYPPQAFAVLYPVIGWLSFTTVRWLWAATVIVMLAWMSVVLVRASRASTAMERGAIVLTWLSMNAVGVAIGNGQLIIHLLPSLLGALVLLYRDPPDWPTDLVVALLLQVALVKPTVALPFACIALLVRPRLRPMLLTVVGYVLLTLIAARFQPEPLGSLVRQWLALSGAVQGGGYGDVQSALGALGWHRAGSVVPAVILLAFAALVSRWRRADIWVLIGLAALVARLWTYHRNYDDALIILPLLSLFRIAADETMDEVVGRRALVLFGIGTVAMLAPARLEWSPPPLNWLYVGGHAAVWLVLLYFLGDVARRMSAPREAPLPASPVPAQ